MEVCDQPAPISHSAAADSATDAVDSAAETTAEKVEKTAETTTDAAEATTEEAADTTEGAVEEVAEEVEKGAEDTAEAAAGAVEEVAEDAEKADEEAMNLEQTQADEAAAETEPVAAQDEQPADAGVQAKVAACAACHGADGNSVIPENPKLAGQVPGFIADQLAKFKSGERENAIMAAQVANLTDEDMKELDDFFSSQQTQLGAISEEMIPLADQGERIYRGGQIELSISACMSCHGPTGDGIPIRFPRVSGQHMQYLETQLLAYKTGSRVSDIMNPIAFRLSEQQIKALAAYMHALK